MKHRIFCLLLMLALLLGLGGCAQPAREEPLQPFDFYYRTAQTDFDAETGPIAAETRDLGADPLSTEALIALYLEGPRSPSLISPFPRSVSLRSVSADATLLTVHLGGEYGALQGVDASLADACIAKTLLALPNIRRVRILAEDEDGAILRSVLLDAGDILLADGLTDAENLELTLYFADANGRLLLTEKRSVPQLDAAEAPQYVVEQLIQGPQTAGLYPTVPVGTVLLDVNVENGVCAVDLSAEFFESRDRSALPPHLTLLSLANTLGELNAVEQVQLYIEGRPAEFFGVLPLGGGLTAQSRAVGPVHRELGEFDGTLCLPITGDGRLYALPLRLRSSSNESQEEALLRALASFAPQNGLENPLQDLETPLRVTVKNGVCTVELGESGLTGETEEARQLAARILIATLCTQEKTETVQITENGAPVEAPGSPDASWFAG